MTDTDKLFAPFVTGDAGGENREEEEFISVDDLPETVKIQVIKTPEFGPWTETPMVAAMVGNIPIPLVSGDTMVVWDAAFSDPVEFLGHFHWWLMCTTCCLSWAAFHKRIVMAAMGKIYASEGALELGLRSFTFASQRKPLRRQTRAAGKAFTQKLAHRLEGSA